MSEQRQYKAGVFEACRVDGNLTALDEFLREGELVGVVVRLASGEIHTAELGKVLVRPPDGQLGAMSSDVFEQRTEPVG